MTAFELNNAINGKIIAGKDGGNRKINGGYCCDLLSNVIIKAKPNNAWITIIGNINTVAVAVLANVGCIILAENSPLDKDAEEKANCENIPVISCEDSSFYLCAKIENLLDL